MFAKRIYPTTDRVLNPILIDDPNSSVRFKKIIMALAKNSVLCTNERLKSVPLDAVFFVTDSARYFIAIDKFRSGGSEIFWHAET